MQLAILLTCSARYANTALVGTTMKINYKNLSQLDVFMALTITELYSAVQAIKPVRDSQQDNNFTEQIRTSKLLSVFNGQKP